MEDLIVWLTIGVLMCGAIGYLHWFFPKARNAGPWAWLAPYSASIASARRRSIMVDLALGWCQRLLTFLASACAAGFVFAGSLLGYLSPGRRPAVPDAALGYLYLIKTKSGDVYGVYCEYLAVNYGLWVGWVGFVLAIVLCTRLRANPDEGLIIYPFLFFTGSATSMALYYVIWQVCLHSVQSPT